MGPARVVRVVVVGEGGAAEVGGGVDGGEGEGVGVVGVGGEGRVEGGVVEGRGQEVEEGGAAVVLLFLLVGVGVGLVWVVGVGVVGREVVRIDGLVVADGKPPWV